MTLASDSWPPARATPGSRVRGGAARDSRSRRPRESRAVPPPPPPTPAAAVLSAVLLHATRKMPSRTGWGWMGPGGAHGRRIGLVHVRVARESHGAGACAAGSGPLPLLWVHEHPGTPAGSLGYLHAHLQRAGRFSQPWLFTASPGVGGCPQGLSTRPHPSPQAGGPVQTATPLGELEALGWDVSGAEPGALGP